MARKATKKLPTVGRHSSGQARVTLNGRVHYLGAFGSLEAQQRYTALMEKWEANGRRPLERGPHADQVATVGELRDAYVEHVDAVGLYRKDGEVTSARGRLVVTLNDFCSRFSGVKLARLAGAHLRLHIDDLLTRRRLTRGGINRKLATIKAALLWARDRDLLPRERWLDLSEVRTIRPGAIGIEREVRRPKRAVTLEEVDCAADAALSPVVARIMRVMARTGMRPGEARKMRWCDIGDQVDIDGVACRVYSVRNGKTAHLNRETSYLLPATVHAMLGAPTAPGALVFPVPGTEKAYTAKGLLQAVEKACQRADVARFTPHEIRHGYLTRACDRYGVAIASRLANHSSVAVTARYVHPDRAAASRAAISMLNDAG